MGHPDSGVILALMEGELPEPEAAEVRAHVDGCADCSGVAEELRDASLAFVEAVSSLDVAPSLDGPRQVILEKADEGRNPSIDPGKRTGTGSGGGSWIRWSLPKAASVAVFLTAGVASALPGSPVRTWVSGLLAGPATEVGSPEAGTQASDGVQAGQDSGEPAVSVRAHRGGVEIWVHELPDQAELLVRWIDGDEAWIQAGEGTRFTTGEGRLEAFSPPGSIQVDLPRALERIELRLDGSILLRKQGGELEILEPTQERTPTEILFGSHRGTNEVSG